MTEEQQQIKTTEPSELEICKNQAEEYLNNWKRERADFINYKKDEAKKNTDLWVFDEATLAVMDAIRDFYIAKPNISLEEFMGISHLQEAIEQRWAQIGIRKILVEDQKFDPVFHEAIGHEDGGTELKEIAPGYSIGEKVIKPARVKIINKQSAS